MLHTLEGFVKGCRNKLSLLSDFSSSEKFDVIDMTDNSRTRVSQHQARGVGKRSGKKEKIKTKKLKKEKSLG